jgi:uracil-DNA glycosylase
MQWEALIAEEHAKDYHKALRAKLAQVKQPCPPKEKIYRALKMVPFEQVKVVILGQDPYHGPGQANGLCFAVDEGYSAPPSLQNIFKEIEAEYGSKPLSAKLEGWAQQGVLLLNTVLTVTQHQALSHKDFGWQAFTDRVITELGADPKPKVFILWGSQARAKKALVKPPNLALESVHPSPLSAHNGFFGCGHFKKANEFLQEHGLEPVDWLKS